MKLPPFDYIAPATLDEAISLLAAHDGTARALAGGQSLLPVLAFRLASPSLIVDLGRVPGLDRIAISDDGLRLGAMVRWRVIEDDARLKEAHPLLHAAVAHVAHYQIRNRGTVGGSLAHADPAAELPGVAVACDATIAIAGRNGARTEAAGDFFVGALATTLEPDELIVELRLPSWPARRRWAFQEFARRRGDFALAGTAVFYDLDGDDRAVNAHIGVIGAGDRPARLHEAEETLEGRVVDDRTIAACAAAAAQAVDPPDDLHASARYRRALVGTLVERALRNATLRAE